jgi:hypothetical protein
MLEPTTSVEPSGERRDEIPRDPSFERSLPGVDERVDRRTRHRVGLTPLSEPGRHVGPDVLEQVGDERRGLGPERPRSPPVRVGDEMILVDDHQPRRAAYELEPRSGSRRRAELHDDIGHVGVGEPRVGEQELPGRQRPRHPHVRCGLREQGPPCSEGESRQRGRGLAHRAREDEAARRRRELALERLQLLRLGRGRECGLRSRWLRGGGSGRGPTSGSGRAG